MGSEGGRGEAGVVVDDGFGAGFGGGFFGVGDGREAVLVDGGRVEHEGVVGAGGGPGFRLGRAGGDGACLDGDECFLVWTGLIIGCEESRLIGPLCDLTSRRKASVFRPVIGIFLSAFLILAIKQGIKRFVVLRSVFSLKGRE